MTRTTLRALALLALLPAAPAAAQTARDLPAPPVARIVPRTDTLHGDVRVDNYFWLRDRRNPEVISYLEAENRYTDTAMAATRQLQETLYQEILGRIRQTDLSVPDRIGPYFYYTRTEEGKQYPIFARRRGGMDAPEEVYFDQNQMAQGARYYTLGAFSVSPDHRWLAFAVDTAGSEKFILMVKNLETGEVLPDRIENVAFGATWAADNRHLFYARMDAAQRPDRIFRHAVGSDPSADVQIYHEPDVLFRAGVGRTKDDRFIVVSSGSFTSSEMYVIPADRPTESPRLVSPRQKDVVYSLAHQGDRFIIRTNADGATNFKLMWAPDGDPSRAAWRELVPQRDGVLLEGIDVFRDHLVMYERGNALRNIRIRNVRTGDEHTIAFAEPVYTAGGGSNPEYDTNTLRFSYQSMVTPSAVYDYDMNTRQRELRKQTEVIGYDPSLYASERTWARAADGAMVPVSLVYRKPLARDGARPMLLYAYGSYGNSTDPTFSSANLSLLDRGVVFAIAHIRGGQEMGRAWYDQGKMLNKRNTFTDFVAAAEHLVREGYTSRERLAIRGGSAGGLLMGAVVNMRPDLFRAVVADVPFVDVINTMADASIPLTAGEWEQWGNPANEAEYRYMLSYSPYDNVERKAYPTMLVTTGLNDPRVAYWEPAKWVARLRSMKTDANLLLLRTNMGAGHGGSSGRYDALRETAFRYAFILHNLGIDR
ncbi:S9 family peptidase [Longimicrobium sp.]|uniref:S9 family peptidase n=1 Tax=Longimicrobium sp. TaxID=2029185 RepID=UPI002E321218|nr:S9 family peptidase [Longimicrobium sp.]HEX6038618.1 S9 family peptidase [Longimicrobium sp.]